MRTLVEHTWPGNVRELRNVVERAVYRWDDWDEAIGHVVFDPFDSPWKPQAPANVTARSAREEDLRTGPLAPLTTARGFDHVTDLRGAVDAHERAILEHHLGKHRYNQRQTAKALGLSYDQLRHAMKRHGLMERGQPALPDNKL